MIGSISPENQITTIRYTAFGEEETPSNNLPWRFSSKRFDSETGFTYFGQHYYDASIGRWITTDPIGLEDGPNMYAFLKNGPLLTTDLYGLYTNHDKVNSDREFFDLPNRTNKPSQSDHSISKNESTSFERSENAGFDFEGVLEGIGRSVLSTLSWGVSDFMLNEFNPKSKEANYIYCAFEVGSFLASPGKAAVKGLAKGGKYVVKNSSHMIKAAKAYFGGFSKTANVCKNVEKVVAKRTLSTPAEIRAWLKNVYNRPVSKVLEEFDSTCLIKQPVGKSERAKHIITFKNAKDRIRLKIHGPDEVGTPYNHLHIYDNKNRSLNIFLNKVDPTLREAHIRLNDIW